MNGTARDCHMCEEKYLCTAGGKGRYYFVLPLVCWNGGVRYSVVLKR